MGDSFLLLWRRSRACLSDLVVFFSLTLLHITQVKLGSRKKRIAHKRALNDHTNNDRPCVYEAMKNIQPNELNPEHIRRILDSSQTTDAAAGGGAPSSPEDITTAAADEDDARILLKEPPLCPGCSRPCMPQALLFDEGYHSHSHYKFETAEEWIAKASALVFVGTSFAVTITGEDYCRISSFVYHWI